MKDQHSTSDKNKNAWHMPLGYGPSFLIAILLLAAGFALELLMPGKKVYPPLWPVNGYLLIFFWILVIIIRLSIKNNLVKWLGSTTAAVASSFAFGILVLLMGFIPQEASEADSYQEMLGLTHLVHSLPFLLSAMFLLIVLAFSITVRFFPVTIRNIAYVLSHGGLWLAIAAGSLGSSDLYRLRMPVYYSEKTNLAFDADNKAFQMPFYLELKAFKMEEYPPTLVIIRNDDHSFVLEKGDKVISVSDKAKGVMQQWEILVDSFIPQSVRTMDAEYISDSSIGSVPAAYVIVKKIKTAEVHKGWITCGSSLSSKEILRLDKDFALAMSPPKPKVYSAEVKVYEGDSLVAESEIIVNKPLYIRKWHIYLSGYDEDMGKWTEYAAFEVVLDPWLDLVYTGIFMMLGGSLFLLWMGKTRRKKETLTKQ